MRLSVFAGMALAVIAAWSAALTMHNRRRDWRWWSAWGVVAACALAFALLLVGQARAAERPDCHHSPQGVYDAGGEWARYTDRRHGWEGRCWYAGVKPATHVAKPKPKPSVVPPAAIVGHATASPPEVKTAQSAPVVPDYIAGIHAECINNLTSGNFYAAAMLRKHLPQRAAELRKEHGLE